jgi:hypothetical protein
MFIALATSLSEISLSSAIAASSTIDSTMQKLVVMLTFMYIFIFDRGEVVLVHCH